MSCCLAFCAASTCGLCSSVASGISSLSARLAYCGFFGSSLILSFILREVAVPFLRKISWINTTGDHPKAWYQTNAVLRVSFGNFIFFALLSLVMIGVKSTSDRRHRWHHHGWLLKIITWALLLVLMFFLPNVIIFSVYGTLSKFGAGMFLLVQVILLLDFTHSWNDSWAARDERKWYVALLVASLGCYAAAFTLSGFLFLWFNPSGRHCPLNLFFILLTLALSLTFALVALHPQVNGSLLPASVISVYCVYVCFTGLSSEPRGYVCNGLHRKSEAVTTTTLVLGMLTTALSVLYSAVRAGSSSLLLSPPPSPKSEGKKGLLEAKGGEEPEEREIRYSYAFFHLIFALASMYSAMLLSGWTASSSGGHSELIDVGWTSVWVRVSTEWITAALYIWTLLAPLLFPDRSF